jgi:suppressor of cytokine signaling 7
MVVSGRHGTATKPHDESVNKAVASDVEHMVTQDTGYGHTSAPTALDFACGSADLAAAAPIGGVVPFYDQVKETNFTSSAGWSLTRELFKLPKYGWYWGPIARSEAEERLAGQPDGAFLLRDSSDDRYLLSLSFRSDGRTLHTRIEHCNGLFSFYAQPESEGYSSVVDLIERSMSDSQSGVFCYSRARMPGSPSFPVRLARPISRFTQVRTLQSLCRFVIRQHTRVDYIQKLPLPTSIKGWLEETQY